MPTPGGKPKVGERIRVARNVAVRGTDVNKDWVYGTVTDRFDGTHWGLRWRIDGEHDSHHLTEAGWMLKKGYLEVVT